MLLRTLLMLRVSLFLLLCRGYLLVLHSYTVTEELRGRIRVLVVNTWRTYLFPAHTYFPLAPSTPSRASRFFSKYAGCLKQPLLAKPFTYLKYLK